MAPTRAGEALDRCRGEAARVHVGLRDEGDPDRARPGPDRLLEALTP
jgi:hypothetical protein